MIAAEPWIGDQFQEAGVAAGAVRTNNAIVGLGNGTGGAIAQNLSAGGVDLAIDVNGYFQ